MDNKLLSTVDLTLSKIQKKHFGKVGYHVLAKNTLRKAQHFTGLYINIILWTTQKIEICKV